MLKLTIMRHAKSDWAQQGVDDHARALNPRGRTSAALLGDWLHLQGHLPDAVLCSTATRTRDTLEGLALPQTTALSFKENLYLADAEHMRTTLMQADGASILLLGHNPGIADLAARLVNTRPSHPRFADYPTGATTVMTFDTDSWTKIGWHSGQPIDFAVPRDLE